MNPSSLPSKRACHMTLTLTSADVENARSVSMTLLMLRYTSVWISEKTRYESVKTFSCYLRGFSKFAQFEESWECSQSSSLPDSPCSPAPLNRLVRQSEGVGLPFFSCSFILHISSNSLLPTSSFLAFSSITSLPLAHNNFYTHMFCSLYRLLFRGVSTFPSTGFLPTRVQWNSRFWSK